MRVDPLATMLTGALSPVISDPLSREVDAAASRTLGQQPRPAHPRDIPLRAGLRDGAQIDVEAEGDRIIISPTRPRYVLAVSLFHSEGQAGFSENLGIVLAP